MRRRWASIRQKASKRRGRGLKADIAAGKIASAYLLIGRNGKVAFQEGFGVQGPGQTTPMSDETIFRVFSMSKPIVSVTAMTLVEEGKKQASTRRSRSRPRRAGLQVPARIREPAGLEG